MAIAGVYSSLTYLLVKNMPFAKGMKELLDDMDNGTRPDTWSAKLGWLLHMEDGRVVSSAATDFATKGAGWVGVLALLCAGGDKSAMNDFARGVSGLAGDRGSVS